MMHLFVLFLEMGFMVEDKNYFDVEMSQVDEKAMWDRARGNNVVSFFFFWLVIRKID